MQYQSLILQRRSTGLGDFGEQELEKYVASHKCVKHCKRLEIELFNNYMNKDDKSGKPENEVDQPGLEA